MSLIDPHNLILHGALVYEEAHSQHQLISETAWDNIGTGIPASCWARRQYVPGAVIPPGHPVPNFRPSYSLNLYEIVPDVMDETPDEGWALGEAVKYRSGGRVFIVRAYTGVAIGTRGFRQLAESPNQLVAVGGTY